jgi:3-oxoacyl-[acyl-carrier protein] reductase
MDLGLKGRRAIVCAASKGLGFASAMALAREGAALTITARDAAALEEAAKRIRAETGADVSTAPGDISTEAGRAAAFAACPAPDILVNNAGGPPPGDFRDWGRDEWVKAVEANMIAPILMMKGAIDGMIARRFGRIVNVTSYAVKLPQPRLGLSNGARAGLTGFVAGLSREVARHNVTINNLLPGPFATDRLKANVAAAAKAQGKEFEALWRQRAENNPAKRIGDPAEFGAFCAYLCAASSGFVTGQNIVIDGGEYPGTL